MLEVEGLELACWIGSRGILRSELGAEDGMREEGERGVRGSASWAAIRVRVRVRVRVLYSRFITRLVLRSLHPRPSRREVTRTANSHKFNKSKVRVRVCRVRQIKQVTRDTRVESRWAVFTVVDLWA